MRGPCALSVRLAVSCERVSLATRTQIETPYARTESRVAVWRLEAVARVVDRDSCVCVRSSAPPSCVALCHGRTPYRLF